MGIFVLVCVGVVGLQPVKGSDPVFAHCKECKWGFKKLADLLYERKWLELEIQSMEQLCTDFSMQQCKYFFTSWPIISRAWLANETSPEAFCNDFSMCNPDDVLVGNDNCDLCRTGLTALAEDLTRPEVIKRTVTLLKESVCTQTCETCDPDITCLNAVDLFMPKVLPMLSKLVHTKFPEMCSDLEACPKL